LLLGTRSGAAIKAENIFLRKQLALYLEREVKPRRENDATRSSLVLLSRLFAWQDALVHVKPETFLGWHRKDFQLLWRWKSRPRGRPRVPGRLHQLIFKMTHENPTWGEERIAAELLLKLGIRVSPRTVRRYMSLHTGPKKRVPSQPWMTFVRNHAQAMLASDFFVVVTALDGSPHRRRLTVRFAAAHPGWLRKTSSALGSIRQWRPVPPKRYFGWRLQFCLRLSSSS
jgi:putative transposase